MNKKLNNTLKIVLGLPIVYLILGTIINLISVYIYIKINNYDIYKFNLLRPIIENKYSNIISGILDIVFFIILIIVMFNSDFRELKNKLKLRKIRLNDLITSMLLGIGLSIISIIIVGILNNFTNNYDNVSNRINRSNNIMGILLAIIIIPIFEEVFFRGIIFGCLRKNYSFKISIIVQALIFSTMHINLIQGVYTFIAGILLALIYVKTKTLLAPIIVHIEYNLFGIVVWKYLFEYCKQASILYLFLGIVFFVIGIVRLIKLN